MEEIEQTFQEDPLYKAGIDCLESKNYEDAVEFLNTLLQNRAASFGDESLECAPAWFAYGNALLTKEEDRPSENVVTQDGQDSETPNDIEVNDEQDDDEDPNDPILGNEEDKEDREDDDADDIQIAWESFEMARSIYEKNSSKSPEAIEKKLAEVYIRLGNLQEIGENFKEGIVEYRKALTIREKYYPVSSRLLAEAHHLLGRALTLASNSNKEEQEEDALRQWRLDTKKEAVQSFISSKKSLEEYCASSADEAAKKECSEIIDEFNETIDALREEIRLDQAGFSTSIPTSTTTIGFGAPSSTSLGKTIPSGSVSTNSYFLVQESEASPPVVINTVQVKKKVKATPSSEEVAKKQRLE